MKQIIAKILLLTTIISVPISIPAFSNEKIVSSNDKSSLQVSSFIGDYYLFGRKVSIKMNISNKTELTFYNLPKNITNFFTYEKDYIKQTFPDENIRNFFSFPYAPLYDLTFLGNNAFILKDSGGYILKIDGKELTILDQNMKAISNDDFEKIVNKEKYSNIIDLNRTYLPSESAILQVKSNMYSLETVLETYAVYTWGIYPKSIKSLIVEAKTKDYWKELTNPYTKGNGEGIKGAMIDFQTFKRYGEQKSLRGLVVVDLICSGAAFKDCFNYRIYGLDSEGKLLKSKNEILMLTNI